MILVEAVTRLDKTLTNFTKDTSRFCENDTSDKQILVSTGEIWALMGLLQVMLFGNLGLTDPVEKAEIEIGIYY
ncbi:hypothetical protein L9F63_023451 [Diploptera punctata]|uniref:Uncharacterized protein n=1 Tax=Diploptera punctata TaxID=6984 RepID=A0AAD7ZIL4_DIPPU|nr:hypothetical protein L9F63_023451 [Diploptera punctata]